MAFQGKGPQRDDGEIGALWERQSAKGPYFTGIVNGERVVVFKNTRKNSEKAPDWRILKSQPKPDDRVYRSAPPEDRRPRDERDGPQTGGERRYDDDDDGSIPF